MASFNLADEREKGLAAVRFTGGLGTGLEIKVSNCDDRSLETGNPGLCLASRCPGVSAAASWGWMMSIISLRDPNVASNPSAYLFKHAVPPTQVLNCLTLMTVVRQLPRDSFERRCRSATGVARFSGGDISIGVPRTSQGWAALSTANPVSTWIFQASVCTEDTVCTAWYVPLAVGSDPILPSEGNIKVISFYRVALYRVIFFPQQKLAYLWPVIAGEIHVAVSVAGNEILYRDETGNLLIYHVISRKPRKILEYSSNNLGRLRNGLSLWQPFGKVCEGLDKQPLDKGQVAINLGLDFDVWHTRRQWARNLRTSVGMSDITKS
ncbi:hypothetical protein WN48_09234 [Eufriesea mexicana]|nr:hypothetical protein WN48_09234 [Eufriesea mexicana]